MTSKMKRLFSTAQKTHGQPYHKDGKGGPSSSSSGSSNPLPSMADLSLRNGPANGSTRSRTPPPPPIFAGYIGGGAPGGAGGAGGFGGLGGSQFFPAAGMPQQSHGQPQQTQFPPPGAFYNGVDVANPLGGAAAASNGIGLPYGNGPSANGGSVNGSLGGPSYGADISFLNALPPPLASTADDLTSPGGSVHSGHSDPNTNNVPPPPRSAGAQSAGTTSSQSAFPTPPPQYSHPQQPQHQSSHANLYHQAQQQPFSPGSAPFPPRQQPQPQQQFTPPPPGQQSAKAHHSLLGGKSKGGAQAVAPTYPQPATQQQRQQQPPQTLHRQQQPQHASSSQMTTQQHAMSNVDVTPADIRDTTNMLRELYKMELAIHGERYAIHEDDQTRSREMRRKADLLREEIENNVTTWRTTVGARWTREELQHVEYSVQLIGTLRSLGQTESS
ncbi:uncharacterized protein SPSK_03386 [Sporothrix schenckii 1099-18]|uniref:Uncharacterized protein n=2 Tax=Sporothrix schenckii TaxID=29908 RepID=U7PQ15_SPOS1|nr:uncharacterized protein SPSK_03386 [Sporothrix schenckii 1099-18]ERS97682.1 hypothetical protein HMPREF1624_05853 [Sporothrix schenckii ATCC 58251]KJR82207.1 hypothetical protein SPSK_03386 [Sporothrix schenckii 1099-18]